jgi:hypothetical protein
MDIGSNEEEEVESEREEPTDDTLLAGPDEDEDKMSTPAYGLPSWAPTESTEFFVVQNVNVPGGTINNIIACCHMRFTYYMCIAASGRMFAFLGVQLFAKHNWRHELTQMLHSRKPYKIFFRDLEIDAHIEGERIAKYTTFGMYLNTHHNANHCYLARCALRRRDNPDFEPGRKAVIRIIPTQCEDPRVDFLMLDSQALTVEERYSIWQGTQLIKEYFSDPTLKYDFEESEKGFIQFLLQSGKLYCQAAAYKQLLAPDAIRKDGALQKAGKELLDHRSPDLWFQEADGALERLHLYLERNPEHKKALQVSQPFRSRQADHRAVLMQSIFKLYDAKTTSQPGSQRRSSPVCNIWTTTAAAAVAAAISDTTV